MVNGKPNLIYGGGAPASTTAAKSREGRYNRIGDSFASLLPQQAPAKQPAAQPAAPQAAPRALGTTGNNAGGDARFHPGNIPANFLSAKARTFASHGATPNGPPEAQSLAQARALAAPQTGGDRAALSSMHMAQLQQAQRMPQNSGPRISGVPVTGRGGVGKMDARGTRPVQQGIGMQDTRKGAQRFRNIGMQDTRKSASGREFGQTINQTPGQIRPQTAQAHATQSSFVGSTPQTDAYTHYANRYGRDMSGQSFLSYGFAGKNAELALKKLGYDVHEARNLTTTATLLPDPYSLKNQDYMPPSARNEAQKKPPSLRGEAGKENRAIKDRVKADALPEKAYSKRSLVGNFYASASQGLGVLAAKFESGEEGIAAIGYDRKGGTSYGKYQIASRPGTMNSFIRYLDEKAPDLAKRLAASGPANTGGRSGKMPAQWRKIAAEDPDRFENLQSDFIRTSHFEPAMQAISVTTGVNFEKLPTALQEVLFSTAVQHGPAGATRIFSQAMRRVDTDKLQQEGNLSASGRKAGQQLITQVYTLRAGQFASSTSRVQSAVKSRLQREMREAIQMLA